MTVVEAAGVGAGLALASRVVALFLHRRWFRQGFAGDSSIHWVIVRTLKRRPRARWIDEYVISPEPMSYPTGFHRVAALFPLALVEAHSWLPNLVLWVVGVAGYAGYTAYAAHSLLHVDATELVWLSLGFLLLAPSSLVFRGPAIAYLKLSERLAGRLATGFAVLLVVIGVTEHDTPSVVAAAAAVALAAVSSVFARQVLGLGLPLLSLAWLDWRPLAVLAGGAALAVLLGRSRFLDGMRHSWIQWTVVYPQLTKASDHFTEALSRFVRPSELRRALRDPRRLNRIVVDREPVRALVMYPEVVAALVLLALGRGYGWEWAAPIAVCVVLYLATSTQRLNHLGEAYRYLEYGLIFVVPLELALLLQRRPEDLRVALLAGSAAWSVALFVRLVALGWVRGLPERDVLGDFLQLLDLKAGDVVFPVTMALGADICARIDGVRSFWWQPGIVATAIYDEFIEELPYLKRDYRPLVEKYAVTHVICDRAALAAISWSYDFSELEPLAEDDRFQAFAVTR